jgi:hypothetical protein
VVACKLDGAHDGDGVIAAAYARVGEAMRMKRTRAAVCCGGFVAPQA